MGYVLVLVLLKPPLATLRKSKISVSAYIDDLITMAKKFSCCFTNIISQGFTRRTVFHAPAFQQKGINRLMDIYQIWKPKL